MGSLKTHFECSLMHVCAVCSYLWVIVLSPKHVGDTHALSDVDLGLISLRIIGICLGVLHFNTFWHVSAVSSVFMLRHSSSGVSLCLGVWAPICRQRVGNVGAITPASSPSYFL